MSSASSLVVFKKQLELLNDGRLKYIFNELNILQLELPSDGRLEYIFNKLNIFPIFVNFALVQELTALMLFIYQPVLYHFFTVELKLLSYLDSGQFPISNFLLITMNNDIF